MIPNYEHLIYCKKNKYDHFGKPVFLKGKFYFTYSMLVHKIYLMGENDKMYDFVKREYVHYLSLSDYEVFDDYFLVAQKIEFSKILLFI